MWLASHILMIIMMLINICLSAYLYSEKKVCTVTRVTIAVCSHSNQPMNYPRFALFLPQTKQFILVFYKSTSETWNKLDENRDWQWPMVCVIMFYYFGAGAAECIFSHWMLFHPRFCVEEKNFNVWSDYYFMIN